jgi:nicotinate-nucleotide pyrophosphorylase (carboxylating)
MGAQQEGTARISHPLAKILCQLLFIYYIRKRHRPVLGKNARYDYLSSGGIMEEIKDMEGLSALREEIVRDIEDRVVTAAIISGGAGILSGSAAAAAAALELGLKMERILEEGSEIAEGEEVARFSGTPGQISRAEGRLIGLLAKTSGIATSAREFVKAAGKKPRVVCGAWSKVPPADQEAVRQAVVTGGVDCSITERPHVYLDASHIEMFGGIRESIEAISKLASERIIVVQIKGRYSSVSREALEAAECGAGIVFIDTGVKLDFMETAFELDRAGLRKKVKIAFGGNLDLKDLRGIKKDKFGIEIVDVGRSIADAPLLDMHLEIVSVEEAVA